MTDKPANAATLTIRLIRSFEYRTFKNFIARGIDLNATTVGGLKELVLKEVKTASGYKVFQKVAYGIVLL